LSNGLVVPRGVMITPMHYIIHRHPDNWAEPDRCAPSTSPGAVAQQTYLTSINPFLNSARPWLALRDLTKAAKIGVVLPPALAPWLGRPT
jgi:hypothetical protein